MNNAQQIIELATDINRVIESERILWRKKLTNEQKERNKMREGWNKAEKTINKLEVFLAQMRDAINDLSAEDAISCVLGVINQVEQTVKAGERL